MTLTSLVAVSYGSISAMSPLRLNNEDTDSTKIGTKFRRDGRNYAEPGTSTGVITRKGSLAFDSDYETNSADVDCE